MKWYKGWYGLNEVEEVEIVDFTSKQVKLKSGYVYPIDSTWEVYRPSKKELKAALIKRSKKDCAFKKMVYKAACKDLNRLIKLDLNLNAGG